VTLTFYLMSSKSLSGLHMARATVLSNFGSMCHLVFECAYFSVQDRRHRWNRKIRQQSNNGSL